MIFHISKTQNLDKQDSSMKNSSRYGDSDTKSGKHGYDSKASKSNNSNQSIISSHTLIINLVNKPYQIPDEVEGVHNKVEAYQIEHTLTLYLKNELYFLISRWLKICHSDDFIISHPINIVDHVVSDLQSSYKPLLFENCMICLNSFSKKFYDSAYKIICNYTDFIISLIKSLSDEAEAVELMKTLTNLLLKSVGDDINRVFTLEQYLDQFFRCALKSEKPPQKALSLPNKSSPRYEKQLSESKIDELDDFVQESMLWIVSAVFEQNYGEEIIKVYENIGVPDLITNEMIQKFNNPNLVKIKNLNKQDVDYLDFNIQDNQFDEYDEQIKMIEQKYDLEQELTEEEIAEIIDKEFALGLS